MEYKVKVKVSDDITIEADTDEYNLSNVVKEIQKLGQKLGQYTLVKTTSSGTIIVQEE